jgi:hypothetical protein
MRWQVVPFGFLNSEMLNLQPMKDTRNDTAAAASSKAKSRAQLTEEPFIVKQRWVKISVPIFKQTAEFFRAQTQTIQNGLGSSALSGISKANAVGWHSKYQGRAINPGKGAIADLKFEAEFLADLRGRRMEDITITLLERQWDDFAELAAITGATPEVLLRVGHNDRYQKILEFLKQ